jgi:hypothetical protein
MCSTKSAQLDRICRAIDELAARPAAEMAAGPEAGAAAGRGAGSGAGAKRAASPDHTGGVARHAEPTAADDIARLAAVWKMVADADPELAKRLPGYLTAAE